MIDNDSKGLLAELARLSPGAFGRRLSKAYWSDTIVAVRKAIKAIMVDHAKMEAALIQLRDCDWVITPLDRMDAVREIARKGLE